MSWVESYEKLVEIEKDMDIYKIKIQNVYFWERIRFQVYSSVLRKLSSVKKKQIQERGQRARLVRLVSSIFKLSRNPFRSPESSILIKCSARRKLQNGIWWDIYSDYLIDRIQDDCIVLETHFNNRHYTPAKTKNLRYLDYIEMITYLKRAFKRVEINFSDDELKELVRIKERLDSVFETSVNLISLVRRMLQERLARLPQYLKLLERIKPRIVILIQGYGWENLIEACRIANVTTIELQHGVISPYHVGYSFSGEKKENFADYLFVWGDYWKSSTSFPIDEHHIIPVGFPYLEEQRKSIDISQKKNQILFISQDTIGEELSKFAVAVNSHPDLKYEILYKLHPQEIQGWEIKYPWLLETNIRVIDNFDASLYELFSESNILVGVGSTALYEGLAFGLTTYIANVKGSDVMDSLINSGFVERVSSPDDLVKKITGVADRKEFDAEYFFKSNATSNMIEAIKGIIENLDIVKTKLS